MKKLLLAIGVTGILLCISAIFAQQLGLDNNPEWGKGRTIILVSGIALLLIDLLIFLFQNNLTRFASRLSALMSRFNALEYTVQIRILSWMVAVSVISAYLWFAWPNLGSSKPTLTNYYVQIAAGFKRQQLNIVEQPSPILLSLSNPYDYETRDQSGAKYPWDVSLYKGKFYFYWGPVPALFLMIFNEKMLASIDDRHLVFAFACGLFLYMSLFASKLWLRFNRNLPAWAFGVSLLAIGLSAPTTWMLKDTRIYEAAVFGSQFFFIGGCYWAYSAFSEDSPDLFKVFLAGLHWALAIGTRITILPAVAFMAGAAALYIAKERKSAFRSKTLLALVIMGAPLLMAVAGLAWYNWARFGSVFEFGLRYQLTNTDYNVFKSSFSTIYIGKNLYDYFILPFHAQAKFPFIVAVENIASNERLAGLLYTSSYLLFAFLPIGILPSQLSGKSQPAIPRNNSLENWLIIALAGSMLITLVIILSFYFPAMRYTEEFMPSLLLLATLRIGRESEIFSENLKLKKVLLILLVLLVTLSIVTSTLIAMPASRTRHMLQFIDQAYKFLGYKK